VKDRKRKNRYHIHKKGTSYSIDQRVLHKKSPLIIKANAVILFPNSSRAVPVDSGRAGRFLLTVAAFVIVVAGMRAAEPILVPLLFAGFLAIISASPVFWLRQKKFPAPLAVFLVVMGVLSVVIGFVLIIGTSLDDFSDSIPRYQVLLTQKMAPIHQGIEGLGFQLNEDVLLKSIDPGASMKFVAKLLIIITNSFLIFLTVVFILLEASNFQQKIRIAFGDQGHPFAQYHKIANAINHYLAIKTVVSLGTGVLVAIWVGALGVDFPVIWGLFAFLLNYIPNLGSIIAAVPPTLLGFIQFGIGRALLVAAGFVVVNMLFGNVVEPKLMGRTLGSRRHAPIGSADHGGEDCLRKQPIHTVAWYFVRFRILCSQSSQQLATHLVEIGPFLFYNTGNRLSAK
jgi:predicted PurR-regulated permease PerM